MENEKRKKELEEFGSFFEEHYSMLFSFAIEHLNQPEDCEDCIQNVLAEIIKRLDVFLTFSEPRRVAYCKKAIQNDEYNLIILDEANIAIDLGFIDENEMVEVLKNKPEDMEIVLTGRNAHEKILDIAHLVSKIIPVKHYWDKGVQARKGIEY